MFVFRGSGVLTCCFWNYFWNVFLFFFLLFLHSHPVVECLCLLFLFMGWVFAERTDRNRNRSGSMSIFCMCWWSVMQDIKLSHWVSRYHITIISYYVYVHTRCSFRCIYIYILPCVLQVVHIESSERGLSGWNFCVSTCHFGVHFFCEMFSGWRKTRVGFSGLYRVGKLEAVSLTAPSDVLQKNK